MIYWQQTKPTPPLTLTLRSLLRFQTPSEVTCLPEITYPALRRWIPNSSLSLLLFFYSLTRDPGRAGGVEISSSSPDPRSCPLTPPLLVTLSLQSQDLRYSSFTKFFQHLLEVYDGVLTNPFYYFLSTGDLNLYTIITIRTVLVEPSLSPCSRTTRNKVPFPPRLLRD